MHTESDQTEFDLEMCLLTALYNLWVAFLAFLGVFLEIYLWRIMFFNFDAFGVLSRAITPRAAGHLNHFIRYICQKNLFR